MRTKSGCNAALAFVSIMWINLPRACSFEQANSVFGSLSFKHMPKSRIGKATASNSRRVARTSVQTPFGPMDRLDTATGTQCIRRALRVLHSLAVSQEQGTRVTDIAAELGLSYPTAHRILRVLVDEGAAEQDISTRRYRIGGEIALLGFARIAHFPIKSIAEPYVRRVSEKIDETVFLTIRSRFDSVCVDRKVGSHKRKVLSIDIGSRRPLGVTVGGLALIAFLPNEQVEAIISANAKRLTQFDCTAGLLRRRVAESRERGYAYVDVGIMRGTRAVAVPVLNHAKQPVAAISMSAVTARLSSDRLPFIVDVMQEQAKLLGIHLTRIAGPGRG